MGCTCTKASQKVLELDERVREEFLKSMAKQKKGSTSAIDLLRDASKGVRADRKCVLVAVLKSGSALEYASDDLKSDKEVVLGAVGTYGRALRYSSDEIRKDSEVVIAAVKQHGDAIKYTYGAEGWTKKDFVVSMVTLDGNYLELASAEMQQNKEVVLAAIKQNAASIRYAKVGLDKDADLIRAAAASTAQKTSRSEQVIFSLNTGRNSSNFFSAENNSENTTEYATGVMLAVKQDPFLQKFQTHNPRAGCQHVSAPQPPCSTTCWRLAVRLHQQVCQATKGFMIQVEEKNGLGDGQKIEAQMANEAGLKIFRTYTNSKVLHWDHMPIWNFDGAVALSTAVEAWFASGCPNNAVENVFVGCGAAAAAVPTLYGYSERPRYEKK